MSAHELLPALRPVEVVPVRQAGGEPLFAVHDNTGISEHAVAVSLPGYFILAHLDGEHTVEEVQAAFAARFRQRVSAEQIAELVRALDQALLLRNQRYEDAYAARRAAYLAGQVRDGRGRWPDPEALRTEVAAILGADRPASGRPIRGLIAPHLDYARGRVCYEAAYRALAAAPRADRYVVLGTNHFGRSGSVVATTKDFQTHLGRVAVDRKFIAALERRLGASLCEHEFDHAAEHSVELQVHVLQALRGEERFCIVPVLCPDPCGPTGTAPADGVGVDLAEFADALAELLAGDAVTTQLIAGADLSHVGMRFGDPERTTPEFLAAVADHDQALLGLLEQRREEEFVQRVRAEQNATRICSVGCIYALLRALPGRRCRVLRYHQAVDLEHETHVTCAAAVVE